MSPETISEMSAAEVAALYNNEFSDMKSRVRERLAFLPRINLTVPKTTWKDKKGVAIGDWYLTPGDTPQGEEPKYENLGPSFACTVLHDAMRLSMRDDDTNKTLIESTEFQNFSGDPIFLFDGRNGPLHIAAVAPYSGRAVHTIAKIRKDPSWPTKPTKDGQDIVSAIGLDFNVYVLLEDGRIAVLNNTKRGHFGTDPETGETCDFAAIAPDSFLRARATCHEDTPGLTLAHRWLISSADVGGGSDEPRPAFKVIDLQAPANVKDIRAAAQQLQKYLQTKWADKIGYAWNNTSPAQRSQLITAYAEIRTVLDALGGNEAAAQIILGKRPVPALLSEPEPDYSALEEKNKAGVAKGIEDLAKEKDDIDALGGIIDVQESLPTMRDYGKQSIRPEDLPF